MSDTIVLDKLGSTVQVGDFVIYAIAGRGQNHVHFGVVKEIVEDKWGRCGAKIFSNDIGKVLPSTRKGEELLVANYLKKEHPELFI